MRKQTMHTRHSIHGRWFVLLVLCLGGAGSAAALDHVTLRRDGKQIHVDGRLLVTAQDGGLLLAARSNTPATTRPSSR